MRVKTLNEKEALMVYYSIRERLAVAAFSEQQQLSMTHTSEIESKDSWDVAFLSAATLNCLSEIKLRYRDSTDFDNCEIKGWLFEKRKYDELKKCTSTIKAKANNLQPIFITFLKDCVAIWDVNKIKEEDFKPELLRATSVTGSDTKRQKLVTYLDIKDAQVVDYKLDFDDISNKAKVVFQYLYPTTKLIFKQHE